MEQDRLFVLDGNRTLRATFVVPAEQTVGLKPGGIRVRPKDEGRPRTAIQVFV